MIMELSFLSRHRSLYMGFAIFWIFFYHVGIGISGFREVFAIGWFGVDIFFFVSGFGLCASLQNNPSVKDFYKRRFIRIIPTWWLILLIMAIIGFFFSIKGTPASLIDVFYWFTGFGWWTNHCNYEWYIPTLLLFYLLSPTFAHLSKKTLVICMFICTLLSMLFAMATFIQHVYMSYSRLSVFIMGFLIYKLYDEKIKIKPKQWIPLFILGIIVFGVGLLYKTQNLIVGLTISRLSIPCFIVPMLFVVGKVLGHFKYIEVFFVVLGTLSLEIYLLHINHEFTEPVCGFLQHIVPAFWKIIYFVAVLFIADLLHVLINRLKKIRE